MIAIITIVILIVAMSAVIIIPDRVLAYRWKTEYEDKYIEYAKRINHPAHRQRVILWLQSKEARNIYVNNPHNFYDIYQNQISKIAEDLIDELTKKYENEYKSRSKQNIKTI